MLFEFFLKRLIDFISLISPGNLFQQFLPWNETIFPPYSFVFVLIGCISFCAWCRNCEFDRFEKNMLFIASRSRCGK